MTRTDPVREFVRAFNERDLDAFARVLHPEVEIHASRGLRRGIEAARLWATRAPGGVQQTIVLDELWEEPDRALAHVTRRWHWDEDGSPAGEDELAWVFELRDGLIASWRSLEQGSQGSGHDPGEAPEVHGER